MVDNINGVFGTGGAQPARRMKPAYRFSETPAPADSVEISSDIMRLRGIEGEIRLDKVMAIKSQIEAGTYFTPDKLDKALDAAINSLFS